MVLMNNNFEIKVEKIKTDQTGNYILLDVSVQGKNDLSDSRWS